MGRKTKSAGVSEATAKQAKGELTRKSELERVERKLLGVGDMLRATIDAIEYGLTVQDKDYNIIYQNEALRSTFGGLGEKCYRTYEGKDKVCKGCPMKIALRDGKTHTSEREVVMPSGEIAFWENTASPIRNARGEIVACLEIARNITGRKRLQEAERKAAEVEKKRAEELEEKSAALLNILEDAEESRMKLERAYKDLAVLERTRSFIHMLFDLVLEPILSKCKPKMIKRLRNQIKEEKGNAPILRGMRIARDGSISFDDVLVHEDIAGISHEEGRRTVINAFSTVMDMCYPLIREALGDEKADDLTSRVFGSLLEQEGASPYRFDILNLTPEGVEIPKTYQLLEPGESYLIEWQTSERALEMFDDMVHYGFPGLCVSTSYPADLKKRHKWTDRTTTLWLSKVDRDYAISPSNLAILRDRVSEFISRNENAVVLLDGLEYLITTNEFDITLKFLHDLREATALNRAILLLSISPPAIEAKQLGLLRRCARVIEAEGVPSKVQGKGKINGSCHAKN